MHKHRESSESVLITEETQPLQLRTLIDTYEYQDKSIKTYPQKCDPNTDEEWTNIRLMLEIRDEGADSKRQL